MRTLRAVLLALLLAAAATPAAAEPVLIDFETLGDLEEVTTQFAAYGITFTGATALVSGAVGGSLNEIDYPPFSGNTLVFDSGGSIIIDFLRPALSVSGRFTHFVGVTMTAYSGSTALGSVTTPSIRNTGGFPDPPNELLDLAFGGGITQLVITGDANGASFTLDDFFADLQEVSSVPEPGTALCLLLGTAMVAGWRRAAGRTSRPAIDR
jgi:hypothetical protein